MGDLLNNSNGCPRMPIRNTTTIKAVSILGAEWRPLQQMKALFLFSSGGCSSASISPLSACRQLISLFILPEWSAGSYSISCSLLGVAHSFGNWVKLPRNLFPVMRLAPSLLSVLNRLSLGGRPYEPFDWDGWSSVISSYPQCWATTLGSIFDLC